MEADWEIEMDAGESGTVAPLIDAAWSGLVDLRVNPEHVNQLSECKDFPALGRALVMLNGTQSPVWSAKCDLWVVEDFAAFDRDEFDATKDDCCAVACYIDILPRDEDAWKKAENAIQYCSEVVEQIKALTLKASRVELILRRAVLAAERESMGITVYVTGCGVSVDAARLQLGHALEAFARALCVQT